MAKVVIYMEIVVAKLEDLNRIKEIYKKIIKNMYNNDIKIWNEYYPNEVFESDIEQGHLYLLKENNNILGAFVLYEHKDLEEGLEWSDCKAKSYLLNRVGVNVAYLHQGIGKKLIAEASKLAQKKGANYLRLLVSDINIPAINLYLKCNFKKVNGIHEEKINDNFSINEYGFELILKQERDAI